MDAATEAVLLQYEEREYEELKIARQMSMEQWVERRDDFLVSVGRATASLLHLLVQESDAKVILELGTSYGYSTIWLAEAAKLTGGTVITVDKEQNKQRHAREMLSKAGLDSHVDFLNGDAREIVASLNGPFDFILLDLWKDSYIECFELLYPKLSVGAFIAADNMLYPGTYLPEAIAYRKHVGSKPHISSLLLPIGNGIELSCHGDLLSAEVRRRAKTHVGRSKT